MRSFSNLFLTKAKETQFWSERNNATTKKRRGEEGCLVFM